MVKKCMQPINEIDLTSFRDQLIIWGHHNFRPFPWRFTQNPYNLLIAEVLLHRTQAKQVVEVYDKFITRFPDINSLANGNPEEIKGIVKPLGLFWRSLLIEEMSRELIVRFNGQIPDSKENLLSLPGVGNYITSSVRCFAFGLPDAIVDTNVVRVVTRLFDIPIRDSLRRNKMFMILCQHLVDPDNSRQYNLAILDLASLICTPTNPDCRNCPVRTFCAFAKAANVT